MGLIPGASEAAALLPHQSPAVNGPRCPSLDGNQSKSQQLRWPLDVAGSPWIIKWWRRLPHDSCKPLIMRGMSKPTSCRCPQSCPRASMTRWSRVGQRLLSSARGNLHELQRYFPAPLAEFSFTHQHQNSLTCRHRCLLSPPRGAICSGPPIQPR